VKTRFVLGVGNPGPDYALTRHNIGWRVLDELARRHKGRFEEEKGIHAATCSIRIKNAKLILVKPLTFVNRSGDVVPALRRERDDLEGGFLAIVDDANLPLGKLRLRSSGTSGGHNGLESLIEAFGHVGFHRLRIGIDRVRGGLRDHVLSRFAPDEEPAVVRAVGRAADGVQAWALEGIGRAMSLYNRDPEVNETSEEKE
jgi:PTH1 family peptidyl-tRNA hydrolase